MFYKTY